MEIIGYIFLFLFFASIAISLATLFPPLWFLYAAIIAAWVAAYREQKKDKDKNEKND